MKNAVRIHERDNVAVVIEPISKGELCIYTDAQGMEQGVAVRVKLKAVLDDIHQAVQLFSHICVPGAQIDLFYPGEVA